ncbi:MAG: extracellular solute-binding protein [Spirochaetales bacterium]|nr:extracellular solute-binding protein [Spirochaetales bacterium]
MNQSGIKRLIGVLCLMCVALGAWAGGDKEATNSTDGGPVTVNIWTKFNDTNPQNTQDQWMAATVAKLKTENNMILKNTFVPYDQIVSKVNLAVQSGGDVPDISYVDSDIDFFADNGTLMDITDFVKTASWYKDISPVALAGVTARDGKIYAIPNLLGGHMLYYWTAAYPDGPPKTTEDILKAGARLAKDGKFAITFKGSESTGTFMFYFQLVETFGSTYTDKDGKSVFATPGTVKAIEYLRTLFANRYAPEVALGAGFDFETPFKDGNAGAFVAGSWSYVYLNPLTSPDGKVFDNGAQSVQDALNSGDMGIADPISVPGGKSYSFVSGFGGFGIPTGSKNVEGAKAFMNFMMDPTNAADYAVSYGGLPTVQGAMEDPRFASSSYWTEVNASINRTGKLVPFNANRKFFQKFGDVVITLIQKPNLDIMTELLKAQDELNSEL